MWKHRRLTITQTVLPPPKCYCVFRVENIDVSIHNTLISTNINLDATTPDRKMPCRAGAWDIGFDSRWWCKNNDLRWRHDGHDDVSNHQPHHCLLSRLFGRISKKASKLRVTGLCAGNSPGTGELPAQSTSYTENVSVWWRHHVKFHVQSLSSCITFPGILLRNIHNER